VKQYLQQQFIHRFTHQPEKYFSVGGRFEVLGNHTDHQHGICLAATCDLSIYAAVRKRSDGLVLLYSDGFVPCSVDLTTLEKDIDEKGQSSALIRGIAYFLKNKGYEIGGFDIYVKSQIPNGAGISSSAAFEVLIATIFNHLFNEQRINFLTLSQAGQFAENVYYEKMSGLLDQIGVAYGGLVFIDFENIDEPKIESLDCDFSNYQFVIVNTKKSHADLSPLYESIVHDMRDVANFFNKNYLREVSEQDLYKHEAEIINKLGLLPYQRAMHFFQEDTRVKEAYAAIKRQDINCLISLMNESCISSTNLLHNMYVDDISGSPLEACELIKLASNQQAGVKINGGGFAGSVIALVPHNFLYQVVKLCKDQYGESNVFLVNVRNLIPSELK
jgi:galactokinase